MRDYAPKQGSVAYACLIELYQVRKIEPINELEARNCSAEAAVAVGGGAAALPPGGDHPRPCSLLQEGACPTGPRRREGLAKATLMELVEQRGLSDTSLDKSACRHPCWFGLHPCTASAPCRAMVRVQQPDRSIHVCWSMLACQRK